MKKLMMVAAATVAAWSSWGVESISVDKVANHYPWDGKVDCVLTLSGLENGCKYKGVFQLSVENGADTVRRVVTNDLATADGTYTNTFDCTALFGAGYYPNGGISVALVKKIDGVQLWKDGPYFAECNVGATKPEEYGYYFWWGDTVGYKYNSSRFDAVDGSATGFEFYISNEKIKTYGKDVKQLTADGYIDSTGNLVAKYDAATVHLGAPWRMPTDAELTALVANCTTTWITTNGVYGRLVTGQGEYASKSIFLPAAGYGTGSTLKYAYSSQEGHYWSSTPNPESSYSSQQLSFHKSYFAADYSGRQSGQSIRPVLSAK